MKKGWLIGGGAVVLIALVGVNLARTRERGVQVEMAKVGRRDLTAVVTASGTIDAKEAVNISATVLGKITRLDVAEGDTVTPGQFMLEIDPTEYASTVRSYEAAVRTSQADLRLSEAQADKATLDLERARALFAQGLDTQEQLTTAETAERVQRATVEASRSRLRQQEAGLDQARHNLSRCTITAPMAGLVTRLNVKEGESAIMGTINNPGTVLAVISDLGLLEARVQVDETEVVKVAVGQPAKIEIDAFPDTSFVGHVTEIGNSPILTGAGTGQQAVDFEVKIALDNRVPDVRPGLTAKAEIRTAERKQVIAAPMGAVTARKWPPEPKLARARRGARKTPEPAPADTTGKAGKGKEKEGVFVVENGVARFRPVKLGIAGDDAFEVLDGLTGGETLVTGPFRRLRDLQDGDKVRLVKTKGASGAGGNEGGRGSRGGD
ncbi:MAG: efflux RND transporter periplasmic adaptor subunit [Candidatus Krumholzibacteriia bacterium]